MEKPIIAIVGRPNVGKSTLFNRLIGRRLSIISKEAGTTRDRIYQNISINDFPVTLIDTGGLSSETKKNIENDIKSQAQIAVQEADLIYFVVNAAEQLTIDDYAASDLLRRSNKKIILIANKYDSNASFGRLPELYALGFGDPVGVSSIHNTGIDELKNTTVKTLKALKFKPVKEGKKKSDVIKLCLLGKPNVGKSSLINALLGEKRVIVSDIPGTTRDSLDIHLNYNEKKIILVDTAGLRRRGRIEKGIEKFSSLRVFHALDASDIALLMLDFSEGITKQDMHIAEFILEAKKGLILVINKSDLADDNDDKLKFIAKAKSKFAFLPWAPVVFISALNKQNITKVFELAEQIILERNKRIPTGELNGFVKKITAKHIPSGTKRIRPKILYVSQTGTNPPEFVFFVNDANALHFSYKRYLENEIRKQYQFSGTAISLVFRSRERRE
ncbi:ribosome biogenesis GTPase Der [Candidatus Peregrinibacteria bacterium]|nr:ribosome biogenesis GTPase Der [Candidatus Peregrinibacteria bacterium]